MAVELDGRPRVLSGWGRTAPSSAVVHAPTQAAEVERLLAQDAPRGVLARGLGRSYGDAAQNAGGRVLAMEGLSYVRRFDPEGGRITVGAGTSVDQLIDAVLPAGWFVPVTPGTTAVTVGGAIAADVHGKNHHRDGGFGRHVEALELQTPGGERLTLSPDGASERFWATTGGMGLTGVILEATLRLLPVETASVRVDIERARDLDDVMARMEEGDRAYRYSAAWIDCLARGKALGRAVLTRGDHASTEELPAAERSRPLVRGRRPRIAAPLWAPSNLLNRFTVGAFNESYFRRAPRAERGRIQPLDEYLYPLDAVRDWNRMYGARGLLQYQFVVPFGEEDTVRRVLERMTGARCPSFLSVIKRLGPASGPLSFPIAGWTLAMDMPAGVGSLGPLLDGLDELVAAAGGRVYLAKDARLRGELLPDMYPSLDRWREHRAALDPGGTMRSDLARRLSIG